MSIFLLFHAFINNGNLFKNGAAECDKICKHYEMNKTIFLNFLGYWTHDALTVVKKLYLKEYKTIPSQNVFENCQTISSKYLPNSHQGISYNRDTCTKNENYYSLFCLSPDKEFLVGMTCFILKKISVILCLVAALKFQRFLPWQIKFRGNDMKLHFASAFPLQCFCRSW